MFLQVCFDFRVLFFHDKGTVRDIMKAAPVALFACLALCAAPARAQLLAGNAVAEAASAIGKKGFSAGKPTKPTATAFKRSASPVALNKYVEAALDTKEERKALLDLAQDVAKSFEEMGGRLGHKNDVAVALGFTTFLLVTIQTDQEIDDSAFGSLVERFQKTLDTDKVRKASDRDKQALYEVCAGHSALVLTSAAGASDPAESDAVKKLAARLLDSLIGATASQFTFKGSEVTFKAKSDSKPQPAAKPAPGGIAPGFSYSMPKGWAENNGWLVKEDLTSENRGSTRTFANIRLLPAQPAQGNIGEALRKVWAQFIPAELANNASGMVFRRYTGDGLVTQFIYGVGREKGRDFDTAFSLYMVDCGAYWQPVVLAQTYENSFSAAGSGFSERFSWKTTQAIAEELFATFRCPAAKGATLASMDSLVGNYAFGNGAAQNWVNIYTGATSTTFWSSGGELKLVKNGTFEWRLTIASGSIGATNFQGEKGKGTWSVQGDHLIVKFTEHDRTLSAPPKERRYKIAGVTHFSDGKKVVILLSDLTILPSLSTITPGTDWFVSDGK